MAPGKTRLQREFAKSNVLRRGMMSFLSAEGVTTGAGDNSFLYGIINDICSTLPEAEIKEWLFAFLECDITAAERAECLKLLKMSETALTKRQRRRLLSLLADK